MHVAAAELFAWPCCSLASLCGAMTPSSGQQQHVCNQAWGCTSVSPKMMAEQHCPYACRWSKKYGPVYKFFFGTTPIVVVTGAASQEAC